MLNAERDYSLLGQRKYIHISLTLTLKLLNVHEWKVFMAAITEKSGRYFIYGTWWWSITLQLIIYNVILSMLHHHVPYMKDLPKVGDLRFSADLVYCSCVLHSACQPCTQAHFTDVVSEMNVGTRLSECCILQIPHFTLTNFCQFQASLGAK